MAELPIREALPLLLHSITVPSDIKELVNSEKLLTKRLKEEFNFGALADDELYLELARALLNCRIRQFHSSPGSNHDESESNMGNETKEDGGVELFERGQGSEDYDSDLSLEEDVVKERKKRATHSPIQKARDSNMYHEELFSDEEELQEEMEESVQKMRNMNILNDENTCPKESADQNPNNLLREFELLGHNEKQEAQQQQQYVPKEHPKEQGRPMAPRQTQTTNQEETKTAERVENLRPKTPKNIKPTPERWPKTPYFDETPKFVLPPDDFDDDDLNTPLPTNDNDNSVKVVTHDFESTRRSPSPNQATNEPTSSVNPNSNNNMPQSPQTFPFVPTSTAMPKFDIGLPSPKKKSKSRKRPSPAKIQTTASLDDAAAKTSPEKKPFSFTTEAKMPNLFVPPLPPSPPPQQQAHLQSVPPARHEPQTTQTPSQIPTSDPVNSSPYASTMDVDSPTLTSFGLGVSNSVSSEEGGAGTRENTIEIGTTPIDKTEGAPLFNIGISHTASTPRRGKRMGPKAKNIKKTRTSPQQVHAPQVPNPFSSVSLGDDFDMSSIDGVSSESFDRQGSVWGTFSTKDAASLNSASSFESMKSQYQVSKEEKEKKEREEQISFLRDEAKKEYSDQNYKESIFSYTEAIKIFTFNFAKRPLPVKNPQQSENLASLYGNRAAALMMVGAFEAAIDDCNYAIDLVRDYNPLTVSNADREELISMLKVDAGLTLMTKLLARMGRALLKVGRCDEADSVFDRTIRVANSAIGCQDKCRASAIQRGINIPSRLQQQSQKVLNQCLTDATLNKADIKRMKGHLDFIKLKGVRENIDTANSREHNQKMMHRVNAVLDLCPAFHDVQIMKVQCLASMKRWSEVTSYCELSACQSVAHDGVFIEDLLNKNPYPNAPNAVLLKSDSIPEDSKEHLQGKYVAEVVLRLPQEMLPLYVRSLRLEERYAEAGKAVFSLSTHLDVIGSNFSHRRQTTRWISVESDKIQRTMEEKEKADSRYRKGEYFSASQMYAQVMLIDIKLSNDPWDMETAGGRLHAVLHCNRAACFMAMKEFDKAAKECTAALRIEQQYMKAMLRRARCYARLGRLEESTSEYERWMKLVRESKTNPNHFNEAECTFDRAADTSAGDFEKASAELKEVRQMKEIAEEKARQKTQTRARKAQEKAQAEAKRASQNARRRSQSAFNRRQNWYDQQGSAGPRRWDSFNGSSPKKDHSSSSRRSASSGRYNERSSDNGYHKRSNSTASSPSSSSVTCHYAILNITSSASSSDIKRAYHKMALKYHPDKNPSEQAAEIFRKVQNSYETLSDAGLRRTYDMKRVGTYF